MFISIFVNDINSFNMVYTLVSLIIDFLKCTCFYDVFCECFSHLPLLLTLSAAASDFIQVPDSTHTSDIITLCSNLFNFSAVYVFM